MADTVITVLTRKKTIQARAGARLLPVITGMAFGNGGVDQGGKPIAPSPNSNELRNELIRKEIDGYDFVSDTACKYTCTLSESELEDEVINELAIYDSDGDLVCMKSFTDKGKDSDFEMTFSVKDVF